MSSVEALPVLRTLISTPRWPLIAHDVGLRREAVAHVRDVLHGRSSRRATSGPAGRSAPRSSAGCRSSRRRTRAGRAWPSRTGESGSARPIAFTMSTGDRLFACSAVGSRSTEIRRCLPPYGSGTAAPCTVASWMRMKLLPASKICCSDRRVAREADLEHGHRRCGVDHHERRRGCPAASGESIACASARRLRERRLNVGVRLEEDLDDRNARGATATRCARCRSRASSARVRRWR